MSIKPENLSPIADSISDRIIGTCDTLDLVFEELGHDELRDCEQLLDMIDEQVFECQSCSWWCEISEMVDGDYICQDCGNDREDDES